MSQLRHEINFQDGLITSVGSGDSDGKGIALVDLGQFNGTLTVYLEVLAKNTSATTDATAKWKDGTGTLGSVTVTKNTSAYTRFRSTAITVSGSHDSWIAIGTTGNAGDAIIKAARIIIIQNASSLTSCETQIEIGNQETGKTNTTAAALTNPKYWKYDASKWDGTITAYVEVSWSNASSMDTTTVKLQKDGGSDNFSFSDDTTVVSAATSTNATRTRVAFTPTDGRNYQITTVCSSNMNGGNNFYNAKIVIVQTASPTKLEQQYLIANTAIGAGTGLQDFDTYFDPAEWSGVTNVYIHEADNVASGTADAKLQTDPNGTPADVTGSAITDIIQRERSSTLTMPGTAQTIDVNQTGT